MPNTANILDEGAWHPVRRNKSGVNSGNLLGKIKTASTRHGNKSHVYQPAGNRNRKQDSHTGKWGGRQGDFRKEGVVFLFWYFLL